jgi:antitoxin PrlF
MSGKMAVATLTSKGQITIPKQVRDALSLQAGDRVSFLVRDDGVVELRAETTDLKDLFGILRPARRGVTVEEMNEAIRRAGSKR